MELKEYFLINLMIEKYPKNKNEFIEMVMQSFLVLMKL